MTTIRGFNSVQAPCSLQAYWCFQCNETGIVLHKKSSQLGYSTPKTRGSLGLASCDLSAPETKLKAANLDYARYRQRRGSQFGCRKVDGLRDLHRSNLVGVPRNSPQKDTASTSTSTEPTQQEQSVKSENNPQGLEQEAPVGSGLSALDGYFSKHKDGTDSSMALANAVSTAILPQTMQDNSIVGKGPNSSVPTSSAREGKEVQGLQVLDAYFEKLKPKKPEQEVVQQVLQPAVEKDVEVSEEESLMKSLMEVKEEYEKYEKRREFVKDKDANSTRDLQFQVSSRSEMDISNWDVPEEQQSANSNLINILVATNIAVYLFGLASPHEALGITDSSLPIVYGAKANDLILAGQWWRFITPMFLHASLLHVGLGSWALLSFGPAVESAYGPLGFAMIYFLGGLFGDLSSFFHTTEWTVGGTGPIYALVGTWVVYLLKNREIIGKEIADDMIRKVVLLSALNVALCNSLPIDDWTHVGAVLMGTFFGFLASPTVQLNVTVKDASAKKEKEDAASYFWLNNCASPARLSLIFALSLGIFFMFYQLCMSGSNDLYLLPENDIFS